METSVTVKFDGSVQWLCPLVIKTECNLDVGDYPFDQQSCPLRVGLWTYDGNRVNLTYVSKTGDLKTYFEHGEFRLKSMIATRKETFYSCCPNVPYPYIDYVIELQRKTLFFIFNLIWPAVLIGMLSFITFFLPPECGERIGLGITNLLSLNVFLLMVSNNVPATSDSIPWMSRFLTVIIVMCALSLVASCFSVKLLSYSNCKVENLPWFVKTLTNAYLMKIMFIHRRVFVDRQCASEFEEEIALKRFKYLPERDRSPDLKPRKLSQNGGHFHQLSALHEQDAMSERETRSNVDLEVVNQLCYLSRLNTELENRQTKEELRLAINTFDRLCFTILLVLLIVTLTYLFSVVTDIHLD